VRKSLWLQGMVAGFTAAYFCIKAFSETDLTGDPKRINVPTLVLRGNDDNCADRAPGIDITKDHQECDAQSLCGRAARHVHDAQGPR
jgi:hypothetical protein